MSLSFAVEWSWAPSRTPVLVDILYVRLVKMTEMQIFAPQALYVKAAFKQSKMSPLQMRLSFNVCMQDYIYCCYASLYQCVHTLCVLAWIWVHPLFLPLPLCAHILVLNRHTGHLAQPDAHLDVLEQQAQVFTQNGDPGSPLARPSLREQLKQREGAGWRTECVEEIKEKEEEKKRNGDWEL